MSQFFQVDDFNKYFDEAPSGIELRTPSRTFDKSKTKLKEGYSYIPNQANPDPVFSFSKTTRRPNPKNGIKGEYESTHVYKMDTPALSPAPTPDPEPVPTPEPDLPIKLSERAADANAYTDAYERKVLPYKGGDIYGDLSVEQNFKNQYQTNLTKELMTKYPTIFAAKEKQIKDKDKDKLDYSLKLGQL